MSSESNIADRFIQGLPAEHTDNDIQLYAQYRVKVYSQSSWKGSMLSMYFSEDFDTFTVEKFGIIGRDTRRQLRDLLRSRGVYVESNRGVQIKTALHAAKQAELQWPEGETNPMPSEQNSLVVNSTGTRKNSNASGNQGFSGQNQSEPTASTNSDIRTSNFGIVSVMKAYSSNSQEKYAGTVMDNLDLKLALFNERCDQSMVLIEERHRAFSAMLKGAALNFYLTNVKASCQNIHEMITMIRNRFVTSESSLALTREWDRTSLASHVSKYPGKPLPEVLDLMIKHLQELQVCLPRGYRSDDMLKHKLLNACDGFEECRLARQKVAPDVMGVIGDLQNSVATYKPPSVPPSTGYSLGNNTESAAMVIERRRRNSNGQRPFFRNGEKPQFRRRAGLKCRVCNKDGCWSTNHSVHERTKALFRNKEMRAYLIDRLELDDPADDNVAEEICDALEEASAHITELHGDDKGNDEEPQTAAHFCGSEMSNIQAMICELNDNITVHALTKSPSVSINSRYNSTKFYGIAIDTCCSHASTGGIEQYKAFCKFIGTNPELRKTDSVGVKFGVGAVKPLGKGKCHFPMGNFWMNFDIAVVNADVPILLSLADMDALRIKYDNLTDLITHAPSGTTVKIKRTFGHPFITWNNKMNCFFTAKELRRLHQRFGHPSANKLTNLLRRADPENVKESTRSTLEKIARSCRLCQFETAKPRRFKFTLREDKAFNQTVYVDVVTIDSKPALHVVDEATRYQAARWLESFTTESIWRALRLCWIDVYIGPPDIIAHDAATSIMSNAMRTEAGLMSITTKPVPVESANSLSIVERYHEPLRRAYRIILKDAPKLDKVTALQGAVKALNDSIGPDGLIPTLLVYGALPKLGLPTDKVAPGVYERARAVAKATKEMSRIFAKRQVQDALRTRNGPDVLNIHQAPLGSHVLVYRLKTSEWDGPFKLLNRSGETCTVLARQGPEDFRTTVCKPFISSDSDDVFPKIGEGIEVYWPRDDKYYPGKVSSYNPSLNEYRIDYNDGDVENLKLAKERWRKMPAVKLSDTKPVTALFTMSELPRNFSDSRRKELNGLVERRGFSVVPKSDANGTRVFGTRFVDTVKNKGTPEEFCKSRLVVQAYNDKDHGLLTHSPTVQRSSQRLLFSLAPLLFSTGNNWELALRDVTQAYNQSKSVVMRPVYVRPPKEFGLAKDKLLRIEKPLYGLPEAGVHWFRTYQKYHIDTLKMHPTAHDLCLLYTPGILVTKNLKPHAITCLQTDDTLTLCNNKFRKMEETESKRFESKPLLIIKDEITVKFNGARITKSNNCLSIDAEHHVTNLAKIAVKNVSKDEFVKQRARGAYIASICRPDLSFAFAQAAQNTNPDDSNARALNKAIMKCIDSPTAGLKYVPLDANTVHFGVFIDASFSKNLDHTSQLGYLVCLMDDNGNANILHYASSKSKRVTRSVLAAELYAMVLGFDNAFILRHALDKIIGKTISTRIYTDSKCLFEALTTLNTTTEKRLLIDLNVLRESYERREISEILWIPGDQNPADALTKNNSCPALLQLMHKNQLSITPEAWIERDLPPPPWAESLSTNV